MRAIEAGSFAVTGMVGAVVDTSTGAALDHQPNPLKVVLKPGHAADVKRKTAQAQ
jgi:hypothetical protein